jgi:hypothetical protein
MPLKKYIYYAKSVAAHFQYTDHDGDFVPPLFSASYCGSKNFDGPNKPGGKPAKIPNRSKGKPKEITFDRYDVHITARREGQVFRLEVSSSVTNLNIKDVLKAERIEAGLVTEYNAAFYDDPSRYQRPRILPKPPIYAGLSIYGYPYTRELKLPAPFLLGDEERCSYLGGAGQDIEPVEISRDPAYVSKIQTPEGKIIEISADTRRIRVENFGIIYFADWKWLPIDQKCCDNFQWVELLRFDLGNPGGGGVGGAGGGGSRPSVPTGHPL